MPRHRNEVVRGNTLHHVHAKEDSAYSGTRWKLCSVRWRRLFGFFRRMCSSRIRRRLRGKKKHDGLRLFCQSIMVSFLPSFFFLWSPTEKTASTWTKLKQRPLSLLFFFRSLPHRTTRNLTIWPGWSRMEGTGKKKEIANTTTQPSRCLLR